MTTIRSNVDHPVWRVARKLGEGWTDDEVEELLPFLTDLEQAMTDIVDRREP
jgi:hypothetical protein